MCGILFLTVASESVAESVCSRHGSALRHRGPDASAHLIVGAKAPAPASARHVMCFHRLAIVSRSDVRGMQPLVEGAVAMVCNGEIYNYRALLGREDVLDVTAVLKLVKEAVLAGGGQGQGQVGDAVCRLDGDFAFVVLVNGVVVAGRDPLGVRPLFLALGEGGEILGYASEAKALVGAPGVRDVRVFPPGHVCVDGTLSAYSRRPPPPVSCPARALVRSLLDAAVRKRIAHSERPVAILCSGGIDSSAVLAIAVRQAREASLPLPRVFTMRYGPGASEDAFYAMMLCTRFGCEHEIVTFGPEDLSEDTISAVVRACETCDPNTIRAALPMFLLARHISTTTDVKVILSGEGADELFGGYGYFRLAPDPSHADAECARLLSNLHMFDLLRADRCFAAHGLEVRVPYLDIDLVHGVSTQVSPGERTRGEKQLLRDAVSDFRDLSDLRILDRPKEKFSDGAGFSYVPDLLRRLAASDAQGDDGTLKMRLEAERRAYDRMFQTAYGEPVGRWVVERKVPPWVDSAVRDATASVSGCALL